MAVTSKGISSSTVSVGSSTFHNQKDVVCLCSALFSPLRVVTKRFSLPAPSSLPTAHRCFELPHSVCTPPARKRFVQHLYHLHASLRIPMPITPSLFQEAEFLWGLLWWLRFPLDLSEQTLCSCFSIGKSLRFIQTKVAVPGTLIHPADVKLKCCRQACSSSVG